MSKNIRLKVKYTVQLTELIDFPKDKAKDLDIEKLKDQLSIGNSFDEKVQEIKQINQVFH